MGVLKMRIRLGLGIGQLDEESRKSLYGFFGMLSTG